MNTPRMLVVYYSRTGNTRLVARALATALEADVEEISNPTDRSGVLGYVQCAIEAMIGSSTEIEQPKRDASRYEVVVVGTPVWFASVSTPVRTYLWMERDRLPKVAFFLTHGGSGSDRALAQMASLAARRPIGRLVLREAEVEGGGYQEKLAGFARALRTRPARAGARGRRGGARKEP